MNKKILTITAIVATSVLAVMGLAFCWFSPDVMCGMGGTSHWFFKRQLLWNGIGIGAGVLAVLVGWRRWLKAAPWVFAGWVVLLVLAELGPLVDGDGSFVRLGSVSASIRPLFPLAIALLTVWIAKRYGVVSTPRMMLYVSLALAAGTLLLTAIHPDRLDRFLGAFYDGPFPVDNEKVLSQGRLHDAWRSATWFSGNDADVRNLPSSLTAGMPSVAACLFGKWFVVLFEALFGILAICMGAYSRCVTDPVKRMYALFWCLGLIVPAISGLLQCLYVVPLAEICVPMVAYGGSAAMTWLGLGVFLSMTNLWYNTSRQEKV